MVNLYSKLDFTKRGWFDLAIPNAYNANKCYITNQEVIFYYDYKEVARISTNFTVVEKVKYLRYKGRIFTILDKVAHDFIVREQIDTIHEKDALTSFDIKKLVDNIEDDKAYIGYVQVATCVNGEWIMPEDEIDLEGDWEIDNIKKDGYGYFAAEIQKVDDNKYQVILNKYDLCTNEIVEEKHILCEAETDDLVRGHFYDIEDWG